MSSKYGQCKVNDHFNSTSQYYLKRHEQFIIDKTNPVDNVNITDYIDYF